MNTHRGGWGRGFTLVEILIGIAVVSVISSVGYVSVTNIQEGVREKKLESDVASLNAAVRTYLGSGGDLSEAGTAEEVIAKLKTRANDSVAAKTVGMTGSFIDRRIKPETQTAEEGASSQARVVWDAGNNRFAVTNSGEEGIKSFSLDESLAAGEPATETRELKLAASDLGSGEPVWVWDFEPTVASASAPPPPPGSSQAPSVTEAAASSASPLSAPAFDVPGNTFTLGELAALPGVNAAGAFTLSISNPNSTTISYLDSGSYAVVAAGVSGVTISSRAISIDPDAWSDSGATIQSYAITPFDPVVTLSNSGALTPFNLGVPRASGSGSTATVSATLSNWGDIPALFRADGNFELVMALASSDPGAQSGSAQEVLGATLTTNSGWDVSGSAPTLMVSAMVKSNADALFNDSNIATQTLTATKGMMVVTSTPASGSILNASETIALIPADLGEFPAGYTIKYTIDGSTPSAVNGITYGSPLTPPGDGTLALQAIALPSGGYTNWFDSPVYTATFTVNAQQGIGGLGGLLVSQVTNNGEIRGDVRLLKAANLQFNGSTEIFGDLYVPGTPTISGNKLAEMAPTIVELDGDVNPTNYSIRFDGGVFGPDGNGSGTVYTRSDPVVPGLSVLDQSYLDAVISGDSSEVPEIPTNNNNYSINGNKTLTLAGGTYGSITVGGTLHIGTPGETTTYNMKDLKVNGSGEIVLHGPVIIFLKDGGQLNNLIGTADHPDWLTVYSQGDVTVNGGAGVIANKVISTRGVTLNNEIAVTSGIIGDSARINGGGVLEMGSF